MNLVINEDVKAVVEFMQASIPANRLLAVASAVNALAPLLWRQEAAEEVRAIALMSDPISDHGPHIRSSASGQSLGL
jgi:hypothetical protein